MLTVSLIQRYFDASQFDRMVRGVVANGSPLPLPLQARLSHAAPAIAMGLHRLVELTYGSTSLSRQMVTALLTLQRPGGSFAGDEADGRGCPVATAAAVAALGAVLREHGADERVESAYDRGLQALASMQDRHGLFVGPVDRSVQCRALTSAFVLSRLADDDRFRAVVRLADLEGWFEANESRLDRATAGLYQLGEVRVPVGVPASAARRLAGIVA